MKLRSLLLAVAILGAVAPAAAARPGDLDATFGQGGTVRLQFSPDPDYASTRVDLVRRAGAATLVAGTFFDGNYRQPFLARYVGDDLDAGFGDGGVVRWQQDDYDPSGVAVDADGRIVVALTFEEFGDTGFGGTETIVRRLEPDGDGDGTFGTEGSTTLDGLVAADLAVAPNGRIAIGGQLGRSAAVHVLRADGTTGEYGEMRDPGGSGLFGGLGFDSQGRLLVAAQSSSDSTSTAYLARFKPGAEGTPRDAAYGTGGVRTLPDAPEGDILPSSLRVAGDGSAFVGDRSSGRLLRVGVAGTPVAGFGDGGFSERPRFTGWVGAGFTPESLAVQADGRILAAGGNAVVRWTAGGDLDKTYGEGGKAVLANGFLARGIALEAGGKAIVGGTRSGDLPEAGFLARLLAGTGTVDTTPPDVTLSGAPEVVRAPTFTLTVGADDPHAFYECSYDGAEYFDCEAGGAGFQFPGTFPFSARANGPHSLGVRATDQSGNASTEVLSWTTEVPAPEILSGPSGHTSDPRPAFTFSAPPEGVARSCSLDGAPVGSCDTSLKLEALSEGEHTLTVDQGLYPGATRTFTVDLTAPSTTITSQPAAGDRTPEIAFGAFDNDPQLSYECRVVGAGNPFTACTSPWSAPELPDGRHYLEVRARDRAGNAEGKGAIAEVVLSGSDPGPGPGPGPGPDPDPDPDPDPGGGSGGGGGGGSGGGGGGGSGGAGGGGTRPVLRARLVGGFDKECMKLAADEGVRTPLGSLDAAPNGGLTGQVKTPGPGRATFTVTTKAARASGLVASAAAKRRRTVVYARGRVRIGNSGFAIVKVKPTGRGKRIVRARKGRKRTLRLVMKGTFKPKSRKLKRVRVTKRFRLSVRRQAAAPARASQELEFKPRCTGDGHPPFAVVYVRVAQASKAGAGARAAQSFDFPIPTEVDANGLTKPLSYCQEYPRECIPTKVFCAHANNQKMFCEVEVDGRIVKRDPCVEDSTLCLVKNHNECAKTPNFCSRYKEMGRFNYIDDWCAHKDAQCIPMDACFNHPHWQKPRNPVDCAVGLSHQYGLVGRPKDDSLALGQPLDMRRYPWWKWWFTNGPGNANWPRPWRPIKWKPLTGGTLDQEAGPAPEYWTYAANYLWPVDVGGQLLEFPGIRDGVGGGGSGTGGGCGYDGQGVLTIWGECAYVH